jgi:hypothetical protein
VLFAAPGDANYRYGPTEEQLLVAHASLAPTATFVPTYTGFDATSQAAFQAALDIWSHVIVSPVPIRVQANFTPLGANVLGSARTSAICSGPVANSEYSAALADMFAGTQSCAASEGQTFEIIANFNSTFPSWDFGTSGTGVSGKYNFMTVVLHEVGHGLGFYGSATSSNGVGSFNYIDQGFPGLFDIYDRFIQNGSAQAITSFPNQSTALHAQLTGNALVFNGTNAKASNSGIAPKIESHDMTAQYSTPGFTVTSDNGWLQGSSYSHVDDVLYSATPNGLMTWQLAANEVYTDPGPIMRGMFQDEGWTLAGTCTYSLNPTAVTVGPAASNSSVMLTTQTGCAWTASSTNTGIATITSSTSGTGSATINYNVSANVAPGPRNVNLTIGGQTFAITQNGAGPTMTLDRSSLIFTAVNNGAGFTAVTGVQAVRMTQTGSPAISWTAQSNAPWLIVSSTGGTGSSTSGSGTATLWITPQFIPGLAATQGGTITITLTGAANTVGPINVTLNSKLPGTTGGPFGFFDTPTDGATGVAGSVAVTGWALDDVQVLRVTICRDAVSGEVAVNPGNCGGVAKVYIGDAIFIDGARTDVQAANPTLPLNSRGGWGYLMLTNFLPNLGNGTFVIYAYAYDADGHMVALGNKTITCNNASSTAPFGAIDTPAQGDVASGAAYGNTGWVLAKGTNDFADPPDGGVVSVFVDGNNLGSPGAWNHRSDLDGLFPAATYPGISHALGIIGLNTTTLTNGVHTIFWLVTGTNGSGTSGIGSRFFTVSNGSELLDPGAAPAASAAPSSVVIASNRTLDIPRTAAARIATPETLDAEVAAAPLDSSPVQGRRGFDPDRALQTYTSGSGGIDVQAEELDRIELHLSGTPNHQYSGYLRTPAGLRPLPVGSSLNASTGAFTWMPGVGFYGAYDLTFVRWSNSHVIARQDVRITLNAKGSNRIGPQTVIDVPAAGGTGSKAPAYRAGERFFVGGWAADLDSPVDSGVSTVHVWAYPIDASGKALDPVFLGPAIDGGARPDVGAVYGDRFAASGYGMIVNGLPAGTYDLAVFAYSTVMNNFTPAKVVRIVVK